MHKPDIIALGLTGLFVLGLVAYRLLWAGSQLAQLATALPGLLPKRPQRWLLGES